MASLHQSDGDQSASSAANELPTTTVPCKQLTLGVDYKQEVRFAVVMYGGVSLAIYINGIAQEMLRWVRSTAKAAHADVALLHSNPSTSASAESELSLSGTERVYRKLSYILAAGGIGKESTADLLAQAEKNLADNETIRTRFVVDILSGTSAGGINGIFLGKALANGEDISGLENLWIKEGDMKTLLNDKQSVKSRPLELQDPPTSLLNSQRMYLELLKAFDSMEATGAGSAPFVDELDLFVTTTDLSGVILPIRLSDGVVYERRHRNVLRFVYSSKDVYSHKDLSAEPKGRNDFEAKFNPFLAYAARCTSAFPAAFEPMCLCDTDVILKGYLPYAHNENCRSDSDDWQRFYKDYLSPVGVNTVKFPKRAFADGGYLDNKPFTYAVETVAHRQADLLITRKLIYIEPSPEHPEEQPDAEGKPDAIENVSAALLTLPRYETIREDLQRVRDHNRLVERVLSILKSVDKDKTTGTPPKTKSFTDDAWSQLDLAQVVTEKDISYVAYHRLDISSVSDDLAKLVTRIAGFDEESDHFMIIRSLVGEWRARSYLEHGEGKPSLNQFLFEFNLSYPMRRINFLRTKISELAESKKDNPLAQAELLEIKKTLNEEYKNLQRTARRLRSRQVPAVAGTTSGGFVPSPVYWAVHNFREILAAETRKLLREEVRSKVEDPVVEYFLGVRPKAVSNQIPTDTPEPQTHPKISHERTKHLTQVTSGNNIKDECDARAQELLGDTSLADLFAPIADALKAEIGPAKKHADENCREVLGLNDGDLKSKSKPPAADAESKAFLGYYYQNYDEYDRIIFPIIYGTEIGEATKVDILRISPEDATALIDERKTGCHKLAGSALGHFAAFLDPLWRQNDIMWGRLDGAERIITALLPNNPELARLLVGEAQAAIVHENIAKVGEKEARDLLCESAMRTRTGDPDCDLLNKFIERLNAYKAENRLTRVVDGKATDLIDKNALRQHYIDTFPARSKLDPEPSVKIAARATTVIGKMLEGLSSKRRVSTKPALWIARLGRIFWALVEVAVPRSFAELFFRHWLKLIYFLEALMILVSTLLLAEATQKFAITLFGITAAIHLAVTILSDLIQSQDKWVKLAKTIAILLLASVIVVGGLAVSAILGADAPWEGLKAARDWVATSEFRIKLGIGGLVFLIFLWTIRKDLRPSWLRRLDKPSSPTFNPIKIMPPYDVHKDRVRKLTLSNRYFIPFRLSDTPPKGWTRMFLKNWKKETRQKGSAFFNESELRLISRLDHVNGIFPGLKEAVAGANSDYSKFLEQAERKRKAAEDKAKVAKERERRLRQDISSTLEKLNSPPVKQ
jgi:patatin-related protein